MTGDLPAWMERTTQLLGEKKMRTLLDAHVLIAGLGGVGSMTAEMLVRAGIGELTLVDNDTVQPSNINRQVPAVHSTIGRNKVEVMEERLKDIHPGVIIHQKKVFLDEGSIAQLLNNPYDFVVDAIDTLTPKILFIEKTVKSGYRLASSMGSGGKTDPSLIRVDDFSKSHHCRLAYLLRKNLRKMGIERGFKVVYSTELVDKDHLVTVDNERNKKSLLGTVSYIPAIFGCMLASIVIEGLTDPDNY
jgi:tRNA A37 threonylcarbamoyladenosine dehydratase